MNDSSDDFMTGVALAEVRRTLVDGLGVTIAFIDDHVGFAVALAQRAVLAGLATDAEAETLARLIAAAEPHREGHERALGRAIGHRSLEFVP